MKKINKRDGETRLERHVRCWINNTRKDCGYSDVEGVLRDLYYEGCASGVVSHLIYYKDTSRFFARFKHQICELLSETIDNCGVPPHELFSDWDKFDPLAVHHHNQNLLAWFGFEETARRLADGANIDV